MSVIYSCGAGHIWSEREQQPEACRRGHGRLEIRIWAVVGAVYVIVFFAYLFLDYAGIL